MEQKWILKPKQSESFSDLHFSLEIFFFVWFGLVIVLKEIIRAN